MIKLKAKDASGTIKEWEVSYEEFERLIATGEADPQLEVCSDTLTNGTWKPLGEMTLYKKYTTARELTLAHQTNSHAVDERQTSPTLGASDSSETGPPGDLPMVGEALVLTNILLLALLLWDVAALPVVEFMMMSKGYPQVGISPLAWLMSITVVIGMFALARSFKRRKKAAWVACGVLVVTSLLVILSLLDRRSYRRGFGSLGIVFSVLHLVAAGAFIAYFFCKRHEFTR